VKELEAKLAESIPIAQAEGQLKRARARLRRKVKRLEEQLAESVPRSEAEFRIRDLESRIKTLQDRLAESLPKAEAEAAKAELQGKNVKLEAELAESVPRDEADQIRAEVEELEKELAASKSEADSLHEQLAQLQARLADSVPKAELETKVSELGTTLWRARRDLELVKANIKDLEALKGELQSKVVDLETELAASVPRTEADALVGRANRLEAALSETREKLDAADRKNRELE
jgi:chromosome segregation ATPase